MKNIQHRANFTGAGPLSPEHVRLDNPEPNLGLLTIQHQRFSKLLALAEEQVAQLHRGGDPDYDLLQDIFFYLGHYPDRFHHAREDLLFAKVAEHGQVARAQVEELHELHRLIAEDGARFLANLEAILGGTVLPLPTVEAPALEYIAHFRRHMALEAECLFPLARTFLGQAGWAQINAAIMLKDDPIFDEPVQGRYRALYHRIAHAVDCSCLKGPQA